MEMISENRRLEMGGPGSSRCHNHRRKDLVEHSVAMNGHARASRAGSHSGTSLEGEDQVKQRRQLMKQDVTKSEISGNCFGMMVALTGIEPVLSALRGLIGRFVQGSTDSFRRFVTWTPLVVFVAVRIKVCYQDVTEK